MSAFTLAPATTLKSPNPVSRILKPLAQISLVMATFLAVKALFSFTMFAGQISVVCMVIAATIMLRFDGKTWSDMGLRWAPSRRALVKGAGLVAATLVISIAAAVAIETLILALFDIPDTGRAPDLSSPAIYLLVLATVWTSNAFGEEMINRGFLMNRFATMFGGGSSAWILAAFAQAFLFGLCHYGYGLMGIIATGVIGLVYGLMYLFAKRSLWPLIIAHGINNTIGMTMLFLGQNSAA